MSRETLDGGADAQAPVADASGADLDLAEGDRPEPVPASPPPRRRAQVLRTAAAALVVAVLAGAFATVAEQRRARAGAVEEVRLLGGFVVGGSSMTPAPSDRGVARVSGLLSVVNAGADAVELTRAWVSGVPTFPMNRPRRVEPGEVAQVHTTVELPCGRLVDDRVRVDVAVVADGGGPGREQQETLEDLPQGPTLPLAQQVAQICSGNEALALVTRMEIDPDGTVVVDLRSLSEEEVRLRVLLAPRMGAVVNGGASVDGVVPSGGRATLRMDIAIEDCERARESVGAEYEVLIVEAGLGRPRAMGYLDGWQPSVGIAAFGFALARQC